MTTELQATEGTEIVTHNATEKYILDIFYDDEFQVRIKDQLKEAVKLELNGISPFLKDSIQGWLAREKKKMSESKNDDKEILLSSQLESIESEKRELEMVKETLTRKIELKDHENKMLFDSLQATLTRKQLEAAYPWVNGSSKPNWLFIDPHRLCRQRPIDMGSFDFRFLLFGHLFAILLRPYH